jgi:hypothetical protein
MERAWNARRSNRAKNGEGVTATDGLLNLTVFRDVDLHTTPGIETNFAIGDRDRTTFLLIPQVDREFIANLRLQTGAGIGFSVEGTEPRFAMRLIYSR